MLARLLCVCVSTLPVTRPFGMVQCSQACSVLAPQGSNDTSHYSLLRWLAPDDGGRRNSRGGIRGPSAQRPMPRTALPAAADPDLVELLRDDLAAYAVVRKYGFVEGLLLPLRDALGNAARLGALLEQGPGPYNTQEVGMTGVYNRH